MAAAWRTGCGCCARSSRTPRRRSAIRCAVAVRFAVDELIGAGGHQHRGGEGARSSSMLAELPDLWDVNVSGWDERFARPRASPRKAIRSPSSPFVKRADHQARGRRRPLHLARRHGRARSARACSISSARRGPPSPIPSCRRRSRRAGSRTSANASAATSASAATITMAPIRCTQNPTMGEEWRKGWHPETHRAQALRATPCSWSAPGRPASNAPAPWASAAIAVTLAEASERAGRPGRARMPPAAAWPPGAGCATIACSSSSKLAECRDLSGEPRSTRRGDPGVRLSPCRCSPPAPAGGGTASDAGTADAGARLRGRAGLHARRHHGGQAADGAAWSSSTTIITTWAACWRSGCVARGSR